MNEEQQSYEYYKRIIEHCKINKTTFKDPDFLPNENSIGKMRNNGEPICSGEVSDHICWLRPHQINTEDENEWSVMNEPCSSDIVQSPLVGDFWLMTPISSIAERQDILDNIFPLKEISPYGVYRVKLFLNGAWRYIIVDDYIPCSVASSKIAVGFAKKNQLWVSLIEKALAKTFGCYSQLWNRSHMRTAFLWLTGAFSSTHSVPIDSSEEKDLWIKTMRMVPAGFLMTCFTISETWEHTYFIVDIHYKYGHLLVKLKKPWGVVEWNGKWSNDWDGWPNDLKEQLLDRKEREFWIELDDFMKMFQTVTICRSRPNRHEFRELLTIGIDTKTIQFSTSETCRAEFSATSKQEDEFEDIIMSIHRISADNIIGDMVGSTGHVYYRYKLTKDLTLDPGEYIIILFNLQNRNRTNIQMDLVCYSTKPISYKLVQQSEKMLKRALREVVLKSGELEVTAHLGFYIRHLREDIMGMIVLVENFSSNYYLHVRIRPSNPYRETHISSRTSMDTTDVIPPRSYKIVMNGYRANSRNCDTGSTKIRMIMSSSKYITAGCTHDDTIIDRNLTSYPIIDPSDWVHTTESLSEDIDRMDGNVKRIMNLF